MTYAPIIIALYVPLLTLLLGACRAASIADENSALLERELGL